MTGIDGPSPHTLEGWRDYVSRPPPPPDALTSDEYAAMDPASRSLYDDSRLNYHSSVTTIKTPLIDRLTKEVRVLLVANRRQVGARQGVIVSGPPTTGKTTALLALGAAVEHHISLRQPNPDGAPVAFVSLPPQATPKSISRAIIGFYGIHPPTRTTFTELSDAALGLLNDLDTKLLIIDEIHNLTLCSRAGAEASDFLKYLAERVQATMVYAGVEVENAGLFDGVRGRQLAGRFTLVSAKPFSYASQNHRQDWTSLVGAFESNLRLTRHRRGTLPRLSRYLYTRTGGHIGSLGNLVRKAAITAILEGNERITRDLMDGISVDIAAQVSEPDHLPRRKSATA